MLFPIHVAGRACVFLDCRFYLFFSQYRPGIPVFGYFPFFIMAAACYAIA